MTPFCTKCQAFTHLTGKTPLVITSEGPIWRGKEYECPSCGSHTIADFDQNAVQYDRLTQLEFRQMLRKHFPNIYQENGRR